MRISIPVSAFVAAIVGFGGTLAIIIAAANAVGATPQQTASMVTALCIAMAVETAILSWRTRMPIITAWSTPGAALVAASQGYSFNDAVGAFVVTGLMLVATGLFRPLTRLISRIPASVASAMLARHRGHLRGQRGQDDPGRSAADPAAHRRLLHHPPRSTRRCRSWSCSSAAASPPSHSAASVDCLPSNSPSLTLTRPTSRFAAIIGLALPLYLVTMASQNLSGLAVLRAAGYEPASGPLIAVTGLVSALTAPLRRADHQPCGHLGRHLHRSRHRIPTRRSAGRRDPSMRSPIWSSPFSAHRWWRSSPCCRRA